MTLNVQLSAREFSAITEWANETRSISEIRLCRTPPKSRRATKTEVGLAVTVSSDAAGNSAFGVFCSLVDRWQRQLQDITGRHVSVWWFGPESPVYEELRTHSVLIWSRNLS